MDNTTILFVGGRDRGAAAEAHGIGEWQLAEADVIGVQQLHEAHAIGEQLHRMPDCKHIGEHRGSS